MASAIDATLPVTGTPTTASVRSNFATAKTEIETLQAQSLALRAYTADITVGRAITAADLIVLLVYNAPANGNFTIPTDAVLGITGLSNASFEIYMKGNGVPVIVGGAGVVLNPWPGYPTPTIGSTQTAHRVGANTWAVK